MSIAQGVSPGKSGKQDLLSSVGAACQRGFGYISLHTELEMFSCCMSQGLRPGLLTYRPPGSMGLYCIDAIYKGHPGILRSLALPQNYFPVTNFFCTHCRISTFVASCGMTGIGIDTKFSAATLDSWRMPRNAASPDGPLIVT